ncbi:hypothetical protein MWN34_04005 [Ancylobacter sp. 6x-1]|uniref:Uncharacterized protein n=1 Tax=Ancylobacter crimeensis TaxID=2579147 RepID=A0ABT0D7Z4_9HYPH|nr:hypothetical protein [Ancylobacter crimeensis]MCK0196071.1 hypothetical protein [Ancylobacter crimeensis]
MHRGHDHHQHDHGDGGHSHAHSHSHDPSHGPGHNHGHGPRRAAQWQTPHLPAQPPAEEHVHEEPDLDLVEKAFVEGFGSASDPTSFLRLANIPFEAVATDGARLALLRVETQEATDMGAVMPHLGGGSFRYDPLPAAMVSRRRTLRFVYFDGRAPRPLSLAEVRLLAHS